MGGSVSSEISLCCQETETLQYAAAITDLSRDRKHARIFRWRKDEGIEADVTGFVGHVTGTAPRDRKLIGIGR